MVCVFLKIYENYRQRHEQQPLLQWMGTVGTLAFPILYLLRQTSLVPPRYDDLLWRAMATLLCIGLAFRRQWPKGLHPFYIGYSYAVVFYCLSFFLTYSSLKNQGGTLSMFNMVLGMVLIILLTDWRNAVAMLVSGYVTAIGLYAFTDPDSQIPLDIVLAAITSILVLVIGALSNHGQKQAELERMRRLYASLAGSVAHEMRTPLAQIQHALRCIDAEVQPDSEAARFVQQAQSAIQRGLQSISITLRQISHRKPPPVELLPLSASACVRKALDEYAYDSPEARQCVRLRVEDDFHFLGDSTTFELMLFNLLKNALYYLPLHPGMEISVSMRAASTPCIVVRDSGPGIPPEVLSRLFEEFQTHGKAEGTGLGLSFCSRTLRAWGGDIQCHSEWGRFTEFTLSFPPCPAPVHEATPPPVAAPAAGSLAGRTVLIVDDERFNRTVARTLTAHLGMKPLEAEHGQQALDLLQGGTVPDVVLMDMNMPGLDGMETTRRLRALPGAAGRVPVFALTANDSTEVHAAARESGMQGVLGKPIDIEALQQALAVVLQG
jgi:signal transduction histidine kinase/CheY-like chemotaxis protein